MAMLRESCGEPVGDGDVDAGDDESLRLSDAFLPTGLSADGFSESEDDIFANLSCWIFFVWLFFWLLIFKGVF